MEWIGITIREGDSLIDEVERARAQACDAAHEKGFQLCGEPFSGELPGWEDTHFPKKVPLKITAAQAPGVDPSWETESGLQYVQADVLRIRLHVTEENFEDIIRYFAVGFDRDAIRQNLRRLKDSSPNHWVDVEQLFPNWTRTATNAFPAKGQDDVCHSPAREFYWESPSGGTAHSRSTEAVEVLLHDFYCPVPDDKTLRFGDYPLSPHRHSTRFILTDPVSGRGISWSIQSGGHKALRFYWMDEDFSDAYAHRPDPEIRQHVLDAWRRCRK